MQFVEQSMHNHFLHVDQHVFGSIQLEFQPINGLSNAVQISVGMVNDVHNRRFIGGGADVP